MDSFLPFLAHLKWFVENQASVEKGYSLNDLPVLFLIFFSVFALGIGFFLDRKLKLPASLSHFLEKHRETTTAVFSIAVGSSLILFTFQGFIFAPNLTPKGGLGDFLLLSQAIIGLGYVLGFLTRPLSVLLLTAYLLSFFEFGLVSWLETLEIAGIGIFLLILTRKRFILFETNLLKGFFEKNYFLAIPLLRILTGVNLIVLGFTEKIFNPNLGLIFLETHPWNFMKMLGFSGFSDYWFVLFSGAFESLFGLVLLLGIVTRITSFLLAGFFMTTLILLGPVELIGHLPHFAIVFVLLINGSGKLKI